MKFSWLVSIGAGLATAPSCLLGCQQQEDVVETRTEPWRAADTRGKGAPTTVESFVVVPNQGLDFDVRGRKAKPVGSLSGVEGRVSVPLDSLSKTQGELLFDLSRVRIANQQEADTPSFTREALRWLGLGEETSPTADARMARFVVQSLRELSHERPWTAPIRKRDDGRPGQIRKIMGEAVGTLKMRSLSVERHIPVWLYFYYDRSATAHIVPEKVVVELRGDAQIPLAEYEIVPRNARGHDISEQQSLLGQEVGNVIRVRGSLTFRHSQAAEKHDNLAP